MKTYTNADFVKKIAQGDEKAFQAFYDKYQRMVYYVAYKTMQNEEDAKDIMQDVFIQIQKSIGNVRNPQYLQLWINRIVVNKCNMMYRKRNLVLFDNEDSASPEHVLQDNNIEHLPEATMHYQNDQELLMRMVDSLPVSQRLMITLMYFEQMTIEEISQLCNVPTGTVKSRLSTARATLKRKIEFYEEAQDIELNFRSATLEATLCTAFLWESKSTIIPANLLFKSYQPNSQTYLTIGLDKILLAALAGTVGIGGSAYLYHRLQEKPKDIPQSYHEPVKMTMKETSKAEEAYFKLMMFANTKMLMAMRSVEEIAEVQKYYDILKEDQGIYWDLFTQTELMEYYEK